MESANSLNFENLQFHDYRIIYLRIIFQIVKKIISLFNYMQLQISTLIYITDQVFVKHLF